MIHLGRDPKVIEIYNKVQARDFAGAIDSGRRLLQRDPNNHDAHQAVGQAFALSGQRDQALYHFQRAVSLVPTFPSYLNNMGMVLLDLGRAAEAVTYWQRAVAANPNFLAGWMGLSMGLAHATRYDESAEAGRRASALAPKMGEAWLNAAMPMIESGRTADALAMLDHAVREVPGHPPLRSCQLITSNYVPGDPAAQLARHRAFGEAFTPRGIPPAATSPDPDRPLRVAFLSSDVRTHSVSYFLEPLLATRAAAGGVHVTLYASNLAASDATTDRLRKLADAFADVRPLPDPALDARIRADKIDILVECSGHSAGNRLPAIAAKPAPLLVTAIGYPGTTGVPAVDLRVADSLTDPPGAEAHVAERLLRLDPCFLCYRPPANAPDPVPPPSASGAAPTFGSFNALPKLSDETAALWARVLHAVPGSRLVLKAMPLGDPAVRARFEKRFEAHGIDASRLEMLGATPDTASHLALYAKIDVALDPTPYNGTTTTCEALLMGVPVVSLVGSVHAARVGLSLLTAAGHPEWATTDADAFVKVAAALAADTARLRALRTELRRGMLDGPLCDSTAYAERFYGALRAAWRDWCTGRKSGPYYAG